MGSLWKAPGEFHNYIQFSSNGGGGKDVAGASIGVVIDIITELATDGVTALCTLNIAPDGHVFPHRQDDTGVGMGLLQFLHLSSCIPAIQERS